MSRFRSAGLVLTAGALLLGACAEHGTTGEKPPRVATLESAPAAAAPSAAGEARGVRPRLDSTEEEIAKLWDVYQDCLVGHGVKKNTGNPDGLAAGVGSKGLVLDDSGEPKSAYRDCAGKKPLPPAQLDPAENPNFAAQWQENVRCLRKHGVMVHVTKPGEWTWDSADTVVPENQAQLEQQCLLETFGAKGN